MDEKRIMPVEDSSDDEPLDGFPDTGGGSFRTRLDQRLGFLPGLKLRTPKRG